MSNVMGDAIEKNDLEEVRRLIRGGVDLRELLGTDETPLAYAASLGHHEIVNLLLNSGADVNYGGCGSAIWNAVAYNHIGICEDLLKAGADPNDTNMEGSTCVSTAVFRGNRQMLELLVANGARLEPLQELLQIAIDANKGVAPRLGQKGSHYEVIDYLMLEKLRRDSQ